ncbi:hypothetical protein LPJ75_001684, partial [Coemansia sp. RSA 2598]
PEGNAAKAKGGADTTTKTGKASGQKGKSSSKKAGSAADKTLSATGSPAVGETEESVADSTALSETALQDGAASEASAAAADSANASKSTPATKSKSGSKASSIPQVADEATSEAKTTPAKEKKGAKGTRKTPAPKEKKPRARSKAAAAKAAAAAAAAATATAAAEPEANGSTAGSLTQPDAEKSQSRAASQQSPAIANNANGFNSPAEAIASGEQTPLARSSDATGSMAANGAGAGADLLMSPQLAPGVAAGPTSVVSAAMSAATATATPIAGQLPAQPSPAVQNQFLNAIPAQTVQIAMAQLNAHLMNIAQQTGRPPMELPTYITKEYLQANPQYCAMLRQQMARLITQQKQNAQQQPAQQQFQQQVQQGAANMPGAGLIGSPQMRPGIPPNMAAMSQMMQTMQGNAAAASTPGSTVGVPAGANPAAGPRPMMMSPNMNASATNSNPVAANANQIQPTREDIILIREYCRISNLQLLGLQDPRFALLINKAKSGELRDLIMARYKMMNAQQQQQQQQLAAGTDQQQQQQQQKQASGSSASSQDSIAQGNQMSSGVSGIAAQVASAAPVNLPRDLSNLSPQDKQRLLEMMMQRKREAQQNTQPGQMPNPSAVSNQQTALASMAAMLQQQRQMNMSAANNMQSPMVRPAQLGGAANQVHQRPMSAIIGSPSPASASLPGQMSAGQLLQHMASANMTPQQRQELLMRLQQIQSSQQQQPQQPQQQQQQQQATAPRPQINIAMIMQQITSGQLNPTMLPPQIISHLLQNSQIQLSAEHRQILQRALAHHFHMQNTNSTGPIQPGTYLAAAESVPLVPRFQHSMEIFAGQLCVFGGKSNSTGVLLEDFLLDYRCVDVTKDIDQKRPNWKRQSSASRFAMPPIAQHSSVYDRRNHIIVPYGGQVPSTFSQANHLAIYCTQFQAWGASNVVDTDPRRYVHTAVLQESSGDMIIFGGASDKTTDNSQNPRWRNVNRMVLDSFRHQSHMQSLGYSDDIHVNSSVGTIITDDGDATPEPIDGVIQHSSILINDTQMVVLGGNTYNAKTGNADNLPFDTVYIYDVDQMKWSSRKCTGQVPPPRSVFAASQYKNFIYIHAGVNVTSWDQLFADLYELDTNTWRWRKMPTPNAPIPRYAHQMKTLGHYLIITHGYISTPEGSFGDENIYFYDLREHAFVDHYSPKGISNRELDTHWLRKTTRSTKGMVSVCYILTILVFFAALYYLFKEVFERNKRRQRTVGHRNAANNSGIRSKMVSYADSWRESTYLFDTKRSKLVADDRRASHDTDGMTLAYSAAGGGTRKQTAVRAKPSDSSGRVRSHSVSEGTSTVIDSEPAQLGMRSNSGALSENMRHTRVLDDAPLNEPYVARRLTLSKRVPGYRARRHSEGPT